MSDRELLKEAMRALEAFSDLLSVMGPLPPLAPDFPVFTRIGSAESIHLEFGDFYRAHFVYAKIKAALEGA